MPVARPEPQEPRVIAHLDLDCFYVQVEQRRNPALRGQPTAVVQYNDWKGGGLIAVSYEARKFGVKRSMRGDEAKNVCPGINLVQVPVSRDKADLNVYRNAGSEVVAILSTKGKCERASIDEVYLDLTDAAKEMHLESPPESSESIFEEATKSNILDLPSDVGDREENVKAWLCRADANYQDKLLACGAILVAQLRVKVLEETQFTCSAGIAHNKMLAKLVSGMHKPAQQTVVPSSSVQDFLASLPVKKMKQLGGKLGSSLQDDLGVETVGDLLGFTEEKLQEYYGVNTGTWLWKTARGISGEEVEDRLLPKSHGCGKTFPGPKALKNNSSVKSWLDKLCEELSERIQSDLSCNKRVAQTLTLHARASKENEGNSMKKFPSKSCPLRYGTGKIQEDAMKLFESGLHDFWGSRNAGWSITSLSVTASKIFDIPSGTNSILKYIKGRSSDASSAILDSSSTPESTPSVDNKLYMTPVHEERCESSSMKEDCDSSNSAKQCSSIEGKGLPKKLPKVQGAGSILKFLSQSQPGQHEKRNFDGLICSHQGPESSSGASEAEQHGRDNINTAVVHSSGSGDTWMLNVEDIDPAVVGELPLEIQREIQGWIRPLKQATPKKRGSTISSYFSPARR
ncbi:DNA polymerase eta-like isoform X1 [Triticum dicoccoides]|uniref:DNA polymerase eta-like isoform X1 n=1 Tax=Triticum dicoccoides TaxID=85692 RepID=UPI00188E3FE6|nr:DNA polymerase eta-like isoform X1 [Triticum dicoccoides]